MTAGFVPPPLVWETMGELRAVAEHWAGGVVDLTIGTPMDPPPAAVVSALSASGVERGYPPSIGSSPLRHAATAWMQRRLGVTVDPEQVGATIGSKEFVAGVPQWLRLRSPDRDTVLYPAISYPTYAMGAVLAGCRALAVPIGPSGGLDLDAVSEGDAERALCLWVNSPGNPTGALDDLGAAARWGRERAVPVLSDECYAEFTWAGRPDTILRNGDDGVLAVHSLSKRSNLAGLRVGFYAGDADLVAYLGQVRKHAGFMVPGPIQAAAVVALGDDVHVEEQRARYAARISTTVTFLRETGFDATSPGGAFYLWVPAPAGDGAGLTRWFAEQAGTLVTPGGTYGPAGAGFVRLALVQPDVALDGWPPAWLPGPARGAHWGVSSPSEKITPSAILYLVPLLAFVVGGVVGVVLIVSGVRAYSDTIDNFGRVPLNGEGVVTFSKSGKFTAFIERPGIDSTGIFIPTVSLEMTKVGGGPSVVFSEYSGSGSYDAGGHEGVALKTFRIDEPGDYRLVTDAEEFSGGQEPGEVAVGRSPFGKLGRGILSGVLVGIASFLFAVIFVIVLLVKRGGAKRRVRAAQFAGAGASGYGPQPQWQPQQYGQPQPYGPPPGRRLSDHRGSPPGAAPPAPPVGPPGTPPPQPGPPPPPSPGPAATWPPPGHDDPTGHG